MGQRIKMQRGRMNERGIIMPEKKLPVNPYPLGAHCEKEGIRFSFVSQVRNCGVILYDLKTGEKLYSLPFTDEERIGSIYCKYIKNINPDEISYQFYEGERLLADPFARGFAKSAPYGKRREESSLKAVFPKQDFDWEGDVRPLLPYRDCVCCCMHVRGFTKHASSGAEHKGTFLGVIEKLPYLKESGFTTIELQPAYEFWEMETKEEIEKDAAAERINYWGYKKGYYMMPKQGYAAGKDAAAEFKEMVKAFHQNGMEIIMQFYFPAGVRACDIPEILRYWVLEYHVDGFHLKGEGLSVGLIAEDPFFSDTKIWYDSFDTEAVCGKKQDYKNLAFYQDAYMTDMRRFLKGDENMLNSVMYHMRHIPDGAGRIHYFSNYYGMTLADTVSYDYKHNEANGEENRDGSNENFSWNCGEEGPTRRLKVKELRQRQIKNAMCLLLFSQSTPLLFMGDEFGNSQKGNNNPYCQDNSVTWLNWNDLEKNSELYEFWKKLVSFRKEHPILHPEKELSVMDSLSCGYPGLSYHGQNAWKPGLEGSNRQIGIMYCGKYANHGGNEDVFCYLAVNMHWESRKLGLPKLPKDMKWVRCIQTAKQETEEEEKQLSGQNTAVSCRIPGRSIAVYISVPRGEKEK